MQTTAIGTVANSLPENKVILITLLNSSRYIPYTDLRKISVINEKNEKKWKQKFVYLEAEATLLGDLGGHAFPAIRLYFLHAGTIRTVRME